jgi:hypothetical protein
MGHSIRNLLFNVNLQHFKKKQNKTKEKKDDFFEGRKCG